MCIYEDVQSDLACEMLSKEEEIAPVVRTVGDIRILRLQVEAEMAERIGRPQGSYLTLECGRIDHLDEEKQALLLRLLAGELSGMAEKMTGKRPGSDFSVLLAGLGNAELTADALGPGTASGIEATRHWRLYEKDAFRAVGCASLSVIAPGVMGQTGMETMELLRAVVSCVEPDLLIVVDALAAHGVSHLASTVQLSSGGISPGSGVGNHPTAINCETVGVPVLVIGVPTVVSSGALVYDALSEAGFDTEAPEIKKVLEKGRGFFVSPKESDLICKSAARLLSRAVMLAFGGALAK